MKSMKIYFVLYIIILMEAFAIIVERDHAQNALFNSLIQTREKIEFFIEESVFKTFHHQEMKRNGVKFYRYFIPEGLISEKEYEGATFQIKIESIKKFTTSNGDTVFSDDPVYNVDNLTNSMIYLQPGEHNETITFNEEKINSKFGSNRFIVQNGNLNPRPDIQDFYMELIRMNKMFILAVYFNSKITVDIDYQIETIGAYPEAYIRSGFVTDIPDEAKERLGINEIQKSDPHYLRIYSDPVGL